MISVVMAVKDNLEWTEQSIVSILKTPLESLELILIDNGSQEETQHYLEGVEAILIRNEKNQGCAAAWNQGVRAARGEFVCIVNNDIDVPCDWLLRLKHFYQSHAYALVSPAIKEGSMDYDLEQENKRYRKVFEGTVFEDEFRGVALFARKTLFDEVGLFDENFRWGKYEDEDFFLRMQSCGLKTAVTTDVCIHHYGSKTVDAVKEQLNYNFEKANRRVFWRKWWRRYPWRKWHKWRIKVRRKRVLHRTGCIY